MSASDPSKNSFSNTGQNSSDPVHHPWTGYSFPSQFVVLKKDLQKSVETGTTWFENIEKDEPNQNNGVIQFSPTREDALRNSDGSGDRNILHEDTESVARFIDEYGKLAREPVQDRDIVLSQGMSIKDILAHSESFKGPLEQISGSWQNMVYAAETVENSDTVIVETETEEEYNPVILPAGDRSNPIPREDDYSGTIDPVYADNPENFADNHNIQMISIEDLAVGRGLQTPDNIRYGELLLSNHGSVNMSEIPDGFDLEDLWEGDAYIFNLENIEKQSLGVRGDYQIDIQYGDEKLENALCYSEDALYARNFHEIMDLSPELREPNSYSENSSRAFTNPVTLMLKAQTHGLKQLNKML